MSIYNDILEKRSVETTYSIGGNPHTFIELYNGNIVPMLSNEPDVDSYRNKYYYNSTNNMLYVKCSVWVPNDQTLDNTDDSYVYVNGRSILKLAKQPDPQNFGDRHYYNITDNIIYSKILKWDEVLNFVKEKERLYLNDDMDLNESGSSESSE